MIYIKFNTSFCFLRMASWLRMIYSSEQCLFLFTFKSKVVELLVVLDGVWVSSSIAVPPMTNSQSTTYQWRTVLHAHIVQQVQPFLNRIGYRIQDTSSLVLSLRRISCKTRNWLARNGLKHAQSTSKYCYYCFIAIRLMRTDLWNYILKYPTIIQAYH